MHVFQVAFVRLQSHLLDEIGWPLDQHILVSIAQLFVVMQAALAVPVVDFYFVDWLRLISDDVLCLKGVRLALADNLLAILIEDLLRLGSFFLFKLNFLQIGLANDEGLSCFAVEARALQR